MSRKAIGVSESLYKDLNLLASTHNLPMTVVLEHLVHHCEGIDWKAVKVQYEKVRPSWSNIKNQVQEYQIKFPDANDEKLAELTGYSVAQVETVTHTAHKRVIRFVNGNRRLKAKRIAEECNVSERFAQRVLDCMSGSIKISKDERYLYEQN